MSVLEPRSRFCVVALILSSKVALKAGLEFVSLEVSTDSSLMFSDGVTIMVSPSLVNVELWLLLAGGVGAKLTGALLAGLAGAGVTGCSIPCCLAKSWLTLHSGSFKAEKGTKIGRIFFGKIGFENLPKHGLTWGRVETVLSEKTNANCIQKLAFILLDISLACPKIQLTESCLTTLCLDHHFTRAPYAKSIYRKLL